MGNYVYVCEYTVEHYAFSNFNIETQFVLKY